MTTSPSTVSPHRARTLVREFVGAPGERRDAAFDTLVRAVWHEGRTVPAAVAAADEALGALEGAPTDRQGLLAVLLGLLSGADEDVRASVRARLDVPLRLLDRTGGGRPLTLALLYLLGHVPEERKRILAAFEPLGLAEDDRTRLERCLRALDRDDVVLGRVWPSPSAWPLSEEERAADRAWVAELTDEQVALAWDRDTRSVRSHAGARALWAVRSGIMPTVVTDDSPHADVPGAGDGAPPGPGPRGGEPSPLRCPSCRGVLAEEGPGLTCRGCALVYPVEEGIADLLNPLSPTGGDPQDVLRHAQVMPRVGHHYENGLRPAFLRSMGSNWGGAVTPADEDAYLTDHLRPVAGPVLDLAAGAGRWTAVVADAVGAERVVALDANPSMLAWLRRRLPNVESVRASALDLPFEDASLGAVNCWNSLQAMPDPKRVITEVGRCLRPGGTFTLMTFLRSPDPVYRHFQTTQNFPGFPDGMPLFERDDIVSWLRAAGMSVRDERSPETFLIITAERDAG
ncbi:methyltransferase domain-containing protein [Nocardiopsis sp. FIRDI 009]|uniref:methyltransferase domain-containing protein n=1 Tax=Nocardiopsis sp. FIRDI 009 TaxID=714197 RepID=UPI000E2443A6|nr:methyltransferase domain-containing protein [Nocardiopsis sp. FIRDI 009]